MWHNAVCGLWTPSIGLRPHAYKRGYLTVLFTIRNKVPDNVTRILVPKMLWRSEGIALGILEEKVHNELPSSKLSQHEKVEEEALLSKKTSHMHIT